MQAGVSSAGMAAGVGLLLSPNPTGMFQKAGMLAPDGRCKTLDAAADGYVRAEAAGMLLLQAYSADAAGSAGNSMLAVLAGSAVNQDGRSSSLTAPNGPAQQEVLRAALANGGLTPADLTGLQMHGTGTALGESYKFGHTPEQYHFPFMMSHCSQLLMLGAVLASSVNSSNRPGLNSLSLWLCVLAIRR
jgi:acyl transferase domain-containing protein